jgi:hypothetical protein
MLAFLASARDYWYVSLPLALLGLLLAWGLGRGAGRPVRARRPQEVPAPHTV